MIMTKLILSEKEARQLLSKQELEDVAAGKRNDYNSDSPDPEEYTAESYSNVGKRPKRIIF
jgi:hypothetical protein